MKSCRPILLVEDSENDVELTLEALGSLRLANEVVVVRDGIEALDYLKGRGAFTRLEPGKMPIVILLDLKLPKLNGLEVLKEIKEDPELKLLPVVVLTSSKENRDLQESYRLGVNAFVVKPIDFNQFAESIKQVGCFWAVINETPRDSGN